MNTTDAKDQSQDFDAAFAEFSNSDSPQVEPGLSARDEPAPSTPAQEPAVATADSPELDRLKAELADALHRERSVANRISSRDRENATLSRRIQELEQQVQQLSARPPGPTATPDNDPEDDVLSNAPDLGRAVERRVQKAVESVQRIATDAEQRARAAEAKAAEAAQVVTPIIQRDEEQAEIALKQRLNESFGGWDGVVRDVSFKAWLAKKPAEIQALYNHGQSFDQCASVLTLFSAETGHQFARRDPKPSGDPAPDPIRLSVGIRPGVGVVNPRPNANDFEGSFAEFASKRKSA